MPRRQSLRAPAARAGSHGHALGGHAATDFYRRDQGPPGGRVDQGIRARRRPEIPPGSAHAILQSHADSGRGRRMQRRLSGGKESARKRCSSAAADCGCGGSHEHGTGRTQAGGEFTIIVEAACGFSSGFAGGGPRSVGACGEPSRESRKSRAQPEERPSRLPCSGFAIDAMRVPQRWPKPGSRVAKV